MNNTVLILMYELLEFLMEIGIKKSTSVSNNFYFNNDENKTPFSSQESS